MADLTKFWRTQKAIASAEYDQKKMLASEMLVNYFSDDSEKISGIIDHFSTDERAAISLIGILAQVGLYAMAMDSYSPENGIDD